MKIMINGITFELEANKNYQFVTNTKFDPALKGCVTKSIYVYEISPDDEFDSEDTIPLMTYEALAPQK